MFLLKEFVAYISEANKLLTEFIPYLIVEKLQYLSCFNS